MSAPHEINRPPSFQGVRSWLAVTRMWWQVPGARVPMVATYAALLGLFLFVAGPYVDEVRFDIRGQQALAQVVWVAHPTPNRETPHLRYQPKGSSTYVEADLASAWRHFEPGEQMWIDYDPADLQRVRVAGDRVGLVAETAVFVAAAMTVVALHRRAARRAAGR